MTPEELEALAKEINALDPPTRLRLAAELMEAGRPSTALRVVNRVAVELQLAIMLREIEG